MSQSVWALSVKCLRCGNQIPLSRTESHEIQILKAQLRQAEEIVKGLHKIIDEQKTKLNQIGLILSGIKP